MDGGRKNVRFPMEKWPYLGNGERDSLYRLLLIVIGSRIRRVRLDGNH